MGTPIRENLLGLDHSSFMLRRGGGTDIDDSMMVIQEKKLINWIDFIYDPFITMPLGINNIFIKIDATDIGSMIAFALNSNVYFEALIKLNYMGLECKVPKSSQKGIEYVTLSGSDDVFNDNKIDYNGLQIEMLTKNSIALKIIFSTHTKYPRVIIKDGKKEINISAATIHFKTGD